MKKNEQQNIEEIINFTDIPQGIGAVKINERKDNQLILNNSETDNRQEFDAKNKKSENVFLFYPGAKVESDAYAPLMYELAKDGVSSFFFEAPFHLQFFDINQALKAYPLYPESASFVMGGHSLGGAIMPKFVQRHPERIKGMAFLASYTVDDFSSSDLSAISIYGENDHVMKKNRYEECKKNLPAKSEEHIIKGGNHGGFAKYGHQNGDGELLTLTQIEETASLLASFVISIA
jgi:hypothetical protein